MISFDRGLAVVFDHLIKFYFFSDTNGWKCDFDFEYPNKTIKLTDLVLESSTNQHFLIAIYTDDVTLWRNYYENNQQNIDDIYYNRQPRINDKTKFTKIGHYDWKNFSIDSMFFMRSQLGKKVCCLFENLMFFPIFLVSLMQSYTMHKKKVAFLYGIIPECFIKI